MPEQPTAVPANPQIINLDQLYREYGEATVQFKLAQGRTMQLEQQIQQVLNQQQLNLPK